MIVGKWLQFIIQFLSSRKNFRKQCVARNTERVKLESINTKKFRNKFVECQLLRRKKTAFRLRIAETRRVFSSSKAWWIICFYRR